jgi:hypothetical protein
MAIRIPVTTQEGIRPLNVPGGVRMDTSGTRIAAAQGRDTVDTLAASRARMQQQRDATVIFNTLTEFGDAEREQTTAWQQRRGAGAHGLQEEATSWWGSKPLEFADKLENEQQRLMFQNEIAKRRGTSLDSLSRFQAQQEYQGLVDASNSRINLEVSSAAQNFLDPQAVQTARQNTIDTVDSLVYLQNGGVVETNVRDAERLKALSKLHVGVIENLNDMDASRAKQYFDDNKSEIDGTLHADIKSKIETGSKIEAAQTLVDELWNKGLRGTKLFDAVRTQASGKAEQDALTLARQRNSDNQAEIDRYVSQRTDTVWSKFDQGGFEALSPSDVEHMRKHDMRGLTAMRNTDPQAQVVTDWATNQTLNDQARTDPTAFSKLNLNDYRDKLGKAQLDDLLKWQDSIKKQLATNKPDQVATLQQQLAAAHDRYKVGKGEDQGQFDTFVRARVSSVQAAKGKELTFEERENVIKGAAYEFDLSWRRDRPAFAMRPEDVERVQISAADRAEVERVLQSRGMEVTDAAIRSTYIKLATAGHFD